jgi:hypothetical protein
MACGGELTDQQDHAAGYLMVGRGMRDFKKARAARGMITGRRG